MKVNTLLIVLSIISFSCAIRVNNDKTMTASTIQVDDDDTEDSIRIKAAHVIPTTNQFKALEDEFIAFVHFGPNTFTSKEWGSGMENPEVFKLANLDTDQWCEAMKAAGMTKVILTVKHHDGFVLWQSRYTAHGIMSTPFQKGEGDILKELKASCEKYGLKLGVYLSPADLYQIEHPAGLYGNLSEKKARTIPRPIEGAPFENKTTFQFVVDDYNEYFLNQLFELLTEYGKIDEVWFDGAHPKTKGGQTYDYASWKELITTLAPNAVIFGRQDIRWCGNEAGMTREEEWNVIPYEKDPNGMHNFHDITGENVAGLDKLYGANFLHYQPTEINTSIREGWFYRNDNEQGVRSADDVFDIYERAVGGNSIFLLNIPPNREGLFSPRDVNVLQEVGRRIKATYGQDLLANAKGPSEVLGRDGDGYVLVEKANEDIVLSLDKPTTINRLMVQEAIQSHGERTSGFTLEAWVDGAWKAIASGKNIGYKNILRFSEVTTDKIKIKITEARYFPVAISHIGGFYAENRPPQLAISRNKEGKVSITAKKENFGWKTYEQDIAGDLNKDLLITYTVNGTEPTRESLRFEEEFSLDHGVVKASAFTKAEKGSVVSREFGILKKDWKLDKVTSQAENNQAENAFDSDSRTYWKSKEAGIGQEISIDLQLTHSLTGFIYSPPVNDSEGMIEKGEIYVSENGKNWILVEGFEFGNLINDPTERRHQFSTPVDARFVKLKATQIAGNHNYAGIAELELLLK